MSLVVINNSTYRLDTCNSCNNWMSIIMDHDETFLLKPFVSAFLVNYLRKNFVLLKDCVCGSFEMLILDLDFIRTVIGVNISSLDHSCFLKGV